MTTLARWLFKPARDSVFIHYWSRSFLCICLNILAEADIYEVPITLVNRVNRISHVFRSKSLRLH